MAACEVVIQIDGGGVLKKAWVYWREGGNSSLLRTDGNGRVFAVAGSNPKDPWTYTSRFTTNSGATVDIYYSKGALPIPDARLNEHNDVFFHRTIQITPPAQLPQANVGPNNPPNTLAAAVTALITLPPIVLTLTSPLEIRLWPIRWEVPADWELNPEVDESRMFTKPANRTADYETAQYLSLQGNEHPTPVQEDSVVGTAIPDTVNSGGKTIPIRPREMALPFTGTIDSRATGAVIQMLDAAGNPMQLRPKIDTPATGASDHLPGTVNSGNYSADVFFTDAVQHFGVVQLFVQSVGMTPPIIEAFTGYLCGFQITLIDDGLANRDGSARGPVDFDEGHDKLVVDYVSSAFHNRADMVEQRRVRRMHVYGFWNRQRPLDLTAPASATNPTLLRPETPMWMAEFQAVGVSSALLTPFMHLRAYYGTSPFDLTFDLQWKLSLTWDGPDSAQDPDLLYRYRLTPDQQPHQIVKLHFGANGQLVDAQGANVTVAADGAVPNAFDSPPTALTFPTATRRTPAVVFLTGGDQRPWGMATTAVKKDSLVVEYQVKMTETVNGAEVELIRGGDGALSLTVSVDGVNVVPATPPGPGFRLPRFRVNGRNPLEDINDATLTSTVIYALVEEYFNQHQHDAGVQMLPLDAWKETARWVYHHESSGFKQFLDSHSNIQRLGKIGGAHTMYHGHEFKMPFFGGPHGYGIVQVDYGNVAADLASVHVTRDRLPYELWSFIDNIRGGILHLMRTKADSALHALSVHTLADARRMQAVFQRAVVRAYNGGTEFHWNGTDYELRPSKLWADSHHHSKGPDDHVLYPNSVFRPSGHGGNVTYFTANGVANDMNFHVTPAAAHPVPPQTQAQAEAAALTAADTQADTQVTLGVNFTAADYGPGI